MPYFSHISSWFFISPVNTASSQPMQYRYSICYFFMLIVLTLLLFLVSLLSCCSECGFWLPLTDEPMELQVLLSLLLGWESSGDDILDGFGVPMVLWSTIELWLEFFLIAWVMGRRSLVILFLMFLDGLRRGSGILC